nr:uncharacterized protein LOC100727311 [Cavia porcellus]
MRRRDRDAGCCPMAPPSRRRPPRTPAEPLVLRDVFIAVKTTRKFHRPIQLPLTLGTCALFLEGGESGRSRGAKCWWGGDVQSCSCNSRGPSTAHPPHRGPGADTKLQLRVVSFLPDIHLHFQTFIFTDGEDEVLARHTGNVVNTNCSAAHSRQALACKMAVEYDHFIESGRKWFCHVDDDNYINLQKLPRTLRTKEPQNWCGGGSGTRAGDSACSSPCPADASASSLPGLWSPPRPLTGSCPCLLSPPFPLQRRPLHEHCGAHPAARRLHCGLHCGSSAGRAPHSQWPLPLAPGEPAAGACL